MLANPTITLSPGVAYQNNGATQTLLISTTPQTLSNQYVADNDWHDTLIPQLFVGSDFYRHKKIDLQAGLTAGFVDDTQITGIVNQFALPNFDNLNYQYDVQSFFAMASLKMLYSAYQKYQPYLDGSLGLSHNHAYHYQETPRITGAVAMSPFSGHSTNSFAYSVGVGLMYHLNPRCSVGLGYQFSDLGKAELGTSPAQSSGETLNLNSLYLNQVLFNLSWNL